MPDTALGTWDYNSEQKRMMKRKIQRRLRLYFSGKTGLKKPKAHKVRWRGGLKNKERWVCFELKLCYSDLKNNDTKVHAS